MALKSLYDIETLTPHSPFRFIVQFFTLDSKDIDERIWKDLQYCVKSVELPKFVMDRNSISSKFQNTQLVFPAFDFSKTELSITFEETDDMLIQKFIDSYLPANPLWTNTGAHLKINIHEFDETMQNEIDVNTYIVFLKSFNIPNYNRTSYGTPIDITVKFGVEYIMNIYDKIESTHYDYNDRSDNGYYLINSEDDNISNVNENFKTYFKEGGDGYQYALKQRNNMIDFLNTKKNELKDKQSKEKEELILNSKEQVNQASDLNDLASKLKVIDLEFHEVSFKDHEKAAEYIQKLFNFDGLKNNKISDDTVKTYFKERAFGNENVILLLDLLVEAPNKLYDAEYNQINVDALQQYFKENNYDYIFSEEVFNSINLFLKSYTTSKNISTFTNGDLLNIMILAKNEGLTLEDYINRELEKYSDELDKLIINEHDINTESSNKNYNDINEILKDTQDLTNKNKLIEDTEMAKKMEEISTSSSTSSAKFRKNDLTNIRAKNSEAVPNSFNSAVAKYLEALGENQEIISLKSLVKFASSKEVFIQKTKQGLDEALAEMNITLSDAAKNILIGQSGHEQAWGNGNYANINNPANLTLTYTKNHDFKKIVVQQSGNHIYRYYDTLKNGWIDYFNMLKNSKHTEYKTFYNALVSENMNDDILYNFARIWVGTNTDPKTLKSYVKTMKGKYIK